MNKQRITPVTVSLVGLVIALAALIALIIILIATPESPCRGIGPCVVQITDQWTGE